MDISSKLIVFIFLSHKPSLGSCYWVCLYLLYEMSIDPHINFLIKLK